MKLKAYEHLLAIKQGFDQVRRNLKALAKYPALRPDEIAQFARLAEETRAATNSHVLDVLAAVETAQAGRLSGQRKARERKEEQGTKRVARRQTRKLTHSSHYHETLAHVIADDRRSETHPGRILATASHH